MRRVFALVLLLSITVLTAMPVMAQIRVYVADINTIGSQNKDEMKAMLQALLASRLSDDKILAVGSAAEADALVTGTYVMIGKIFSIDALAKSPSGKTLARSFAQGEGQDELIPALGKLADKLRADLAQVYSSGQANTVGAPAAVAVPVPVPRTSDIIKAETQASRAPASEFIKPADYERNSTGGWQSKRIVGAANLMALGKILADGSREIFLAESRLLSYYRQSGDMKLVAEMELAVNEKILSLDVLDAGDGTLELYMTVMRGEDLNSKVVRVQGDKLVTVAEKLPYYFRTMSLAGGPNKLYAQTSGPDTDFYGDVAEATRSAAGILLKNPIKMPRYGNIYNFNQFNDKDGTRYTVVINPDGYLVVYDQTNKELWRSNDKFGGSELYFQKEDVNYLRTVTDRYRWIFLNQRIIATAKGEVLVGKNDGFWVLGNSRTYKKGAVYSMSWNGSSLEEKWRTRDTQNYMADYAFDEARNELLILQTVQRTALSDRGASSLSIKKVE